MLQSNLVGGLKESDAPVVAGGSVQWILANSGDTKWPCATTLRLIGGPILMSPIVDVPALDPGQTVIIDLDVQAATECATVFYTLISPDGQPFGDVLTAKVMPESESFVPKPMCLVLDSPIMACEKGLEALQGEVKVMEWQLANVGAVAWPNDAVATLIYNSPSLKDLSALVEIPAIDPGMTIHVGVSVQMPEMPGHFKAMWAVHSPTHPDFGETLHAEFNVGDFPFMEWMAMEKPTNHVASAEPESQSVLAADQEESCGDGSSKTLKGVEHRQGRYTCEVPNCGKCIGMQSCPSVQTPITSAHPELKHRYTVSISNKFAHLTPQDDDIDEEGALEGSSDESGTKLGNSPAIAERRRAKKNKQFKSQAEECEEIWAMQLEQFEEMAETQKQARLKEKMQMQEEIDKQEEVDDGEHVIDDCQCQPVQGQEDKQPEQEEMDNNHQAEVTQEQGNDSSNLDNSKKSNLEVGSKVEVRNTDEDMWKLGTVASIGPLTVIVGDDMMAFEYQQVRSLGFEVGMKVEARNDEGQAWEQGTVASGEPLTVFLGNNAMAFEYKHVRPASYNKDRWPFSFLHFIVVALLVIVHLVFGRSTTRPFVDLGLEDGKPSLLGKTWLASNTSSSQQETTKATVQRMIEMGHLRLSMSDCVGAERWFAKALDRRALQGLGRSRSGNWSQLTGPEHMAILGDHGFALVCAQRFQEGASILNHVVLHAGLETSPPHQVNALGYALFHSRNYGHAKEVFGVIAKTHANNAVLWNNLAAASTLAGDSATAEDALIHALHLSSRLKPSMKEYYEQIFSNNVHVLRGSPSARGRLPWVELFHCMPTSLSVMAKSKDPVEFQHTFAEVAERHEDKPLDADQLAHSRSAVLALDPEPLFCP
mmetsp:Transcript_20927/g.38869  ORF Transcript_20927/g.38869 Transcript_20927/m.38869 type:complete len:877 (+) Transcript_20927:131-2761(+)